MWRAAIMLTTLAMVTALLPRSLHAAEMFEGKVASIGASRLSIIEKGGDNQQFDVADNAKVTLNGKPAKLMDVEVGDVVKLTVKEREGKPMVVAIEARDAE